MIHITGLNKYYNKGKSNELHVINETTLQLEDTGLVCILGESGSGKTTLMNTVSGLDDFSSGTISVDGEEISKYGTANQEKIRNEKFGYIFQNYYLLQDQTVEYNILIGLALYDITEEEKQERINYVLEAVDMRRYKKRLVSQLSGGQQQRIAIARALAKMPRVIFADEPTGNLDEANTMRIMSILKKVSQNCLVVVVTHERSIAEFFADRILWITDGRIEKEEQRSGDGVYHFYDDNNIYLQELDRQEFQNAQVKLELYQQPDTEMPPLTVQLIYENDRIYISTGANTDLSVDFLTPESEKKVVDSKRPVAEMADVESFAYDLKPISNTRIPKLGLRESWQMALQNIRTLGKKQVFLIIALLAMSALIVLAAQDLMTILDINKEEAVISDSHILELKAEKNDMVTDEELSDAVAQSLEAMRASGLPLEIQMGSRADMSYRYEGFWQLEGISAKLNQFSIVNVSRLDESQLIYGRMPEQSTEIVVDRWVLSNFMKSGSQITNVVNSIEHFLNKSVVSQYNNMVFTIVGISDSEQPDIYMMPSAMMTSGPYIDNIQFFSEFKKNNPQTDMEVAPGECLLTKSNYQKVMLAYTKDNYSAYETLRQWWDDQDILDAFAGKEGETYEEIRARFENNPEKDRAVMSFADYLESLETWEGFPLTTKLSNGVELRVKWYFENSQTTADVIVNDDDYEKLLSASICKYRELSVYAEDKDAVKEYLQNGLPQEIAAKLKYMVTDSYEKDMEAYRAAKQLKFDARIIITITIFVISFIILYFMMKANAIARMQDLSVYRLLGVAKSSIVGLFAIENLVISAYTILPAVLLTTLVTKMISGIEALNITVIYPWYAVLATLVFLVAVTVLIGILPICRILRMPPAQLASKYDI